MSIRSIATSVHTPDWTTRFNAFRARSMARSTIVPGPLDCAHPWQPRGIDRAGGFGDGLTADPQQSPEIDAGGRTGGRIEAIEGVDERDVLSAARRRPEPGPHHAGSSRGRRPYDFGDLTARESSGQAAVDHLDLERGHIAFLPVGHGGGEGAIEFPLAKKCFDCCSSGHGVLLCGRQSLRFAYCFV